MLYVWSDELATGNVMIDTQHKQLIKMVNDLMEACKSGHGRAKLSSTMQFLIDYTIKHFADEEKLQHQHSYPDFANHRKLHEAFKVTVLELDKELKA
ncbi:MAG: bacteriohemerythrin, partial [Oscillospiraceae bacterium]|nr:bacteriohemerythrin [Oscillospiraceae bacterium]